MKDTQQLLLETNQLLKKLLQRRSLWYSFLSGIAHSLGATLGFALVLGLVTYILQHLEITKILGQWLSQILGEALGSHWTL